MPQLPVALGLTATVLSTPLCAKAKRFSAGLSLALLLFVLLPNEIVSASLVDAWQASDFLPFLNDGDSVASWSSTGGRALTSSSTSGLRPRFYLNATPAGGPAVRFDQDRL